MSTVAFRYVLGKLLETWGLALTGYALYVGINDDAMDKEFALLGAGVVVFLIGYFVEGRSD